MKKILLLMTWGFISLFGAQLTLINGEVKAHTEVFGDANIEPKTNIITSHLTMKQGINSIRGYVNVSILKLHSDNDTRDEHMEEALESDKYPLARFDFLNIKKHQKTYSIEGTLTFHGVKHPLTIDALVTDDGKKIKIKGKTAFKLSEYKIKPIKMLFLTVRDRIDIAINVTFKKSK